MVRVTATEFQRNPGRYQDLALEEPVTVTKSGRDRTVMLSAREYARLKTYDRRVLTLDDFTDADIAALEASKAPDDTAQYDHELD